MMKAMNGLLFPAVLLAVSIAPTSIFAQIGDGHNVTVVASGLQGPRGLKFGPDGMIYVAEAGTGGTAFTTPAECQQVPGPIGPYTNGNTGRISRIDMKGNRTTVASGFPSSASADPTHDTSSVGDVAFLDGHLFAVLAGGGCSHGNSAIPNAIVAVNPSTGVWKMVANLSAFIKAHPTDYPNPADFEPDGTFYSLITVGDRLYTVEPNRGEILSSDVNGNLRRDMDVSRTQGHIVPTSLAEQNGFFYLGNLGVFPINPTSSVILTLMPGVAPQGSVLPLPDLYPSPIKLGLVASKAGFTTIVGTTFGPDGLLYVLELSDAVGYPAPGNGKVLRILANGGIQEVATNLSVPTAMTFGPDGDIYVSNWGAAPAGAGEIVRVHLQH